MTTKFHRFPGYLYITWLLLTFPLVGSGQVFKDRSVLAEGVFYKLGIPEAGIYRINAAFLEKAGIPAREIDPESLQVYTHLHGMLPQANATPTVDDLLEIPTYLSVQEEGIFGDEDYLLFYAEGPGKRTYDTLQRRFVYQKNLYDTLHYVFLSIGAKKGQRISRQPSLIYGQGTTIRHFDDFIHLEDDQHNLLHSGREWYGQELWEDEPSQEFHLNLPGLLGFEEMKIGFAAASKATSASHFSLDYQGQNIGALEVQAAQATTFGYKARTASQQFAHRLGYQPDSLMRIKITYDGGSASGYTDFLAVQAKRTLQLYGTQTAFRSLETIDSRISEYRIKAPAYDKVMIWDVTDPLHAKEQSFSRIAEEIRFKTFNDYQLKEYVFFKEQADIPVPVFVKKLPNQNLHGLPTPELLIISPVQFIPEAERLAAFRRTHDGLSAEVVSLPEIYNEFSSGRQDVSAVRNFIRMLYLRDQSLKYVLLFGDASYDYLKRVKQNTNLVPTYQSLISTHDVHSYASDDFFGFLEEQEGDWPESGNQLKPHTLDVAIGRLPVNSREEAKYVIDKLIHYSSAPASLGKWRNKILFVADDGDDNKHQLMSDQLASRTENQYPQLLAQRLFLDAYPQEEYSAPEVTKALQKHLDLGVLLVDFIGHGGETAWTNEQILEAQQIKEWKNLDHLPLLLTATCEFGRFDDPRRASGAEMALLQPDGGAIGLLTTTRPVFPGTNFKVSSAFYAIAFEPLPDGNMPRLGDIFRLTKNNSISGLSNRNFSLLGDPSMSLALPRQKVSIQGVFSEEGIVLDSIRPLQAFVLKASVNKADGLADQDFHGTAFINIYDKAQKEETLGSDGPETVMQFESRDRLLLQAKVKVKNGQIVTKLRLPKNIDPEAGNMKIHVYAQHENAVMDAIGGKADVLLAGEAIPIQDRNAPNIRLFLNHKQFTDGGQVHPGPVLIAVLEDESGINITESRHGIVASIDGQPWGPYQLGAYFESDTEAFGSGELKFPLKDLPVGNHTLRLEASDNNLNRTSQSLNFTITEDSVLIFSKILAYPNPSPDGDVNFALSFAPEQQSLQIRLLIYDSQGNLIAEVEENLQDEVEDYTFLWQGSELSLRPGIYLYSLHLHKNQQNLLTKQEKLIVR